MQYLIIGMIMALAGFWGVLWYKGDPSDSSAVQGVQNNSLSPTVTGTPPYIDLQPPSRALKGALSAPTGIIQIYKRGAAEAREMTVQDVAEDGESVIAEAESNGILTFPAFGTIELGEFANLTFGSALAQSFLVEQTSGTASYTHIARETVMSVRSRGVLVSIQRAEVFVSTDPETGVVLVRPENGSVTFAYLNENFEKQIVTVKTGEEAIIDTNTATAEVVDASEESADAL